MTTDKKTEVTLTLDYKDFYGLLTAVETAQELDGTEDYTYLKDLLLKKVFELAAGPSAGWMRLDEAGRYVKNHATPVHMDFRVRLAGPDVKKIQAIKNVRMLTYLGLKEAKDYIDGVGQGMGRWCPAPDHARIEEDTFARLPWDCGFEWQFKLADFWGSR